MADDLSVKLDGGRFDRVSVTGAELWAAEITDTRFRNSDFVRVVMRGVTLADVDIDGQIDGLTINGVDVGPLITAELDRRYPERAKMRPTDPTGFREAWDIVERLWQGTVDRARRLDPELLHESVDGEWSFIETLRHLSHATDCWVRRAILGEPTPWDPLGLPFEDMPETPGMPRDRTARPSLDTVLALRQDRMATVRRVIDEVTDESLDRMTEPVDAPGWPPPGRTYPVRKCLLVILGEEWEHRLFAERDLAVLEARGS